MDALTLILTIVFGFGLIAGLAATGGTDSRDWIDSRPWWPGRSGTEDGRTLV